jgi:hypothetical protein
VVYLNRKKNLLNLQSFGNRNCRDKKLGYGLFSEIAVMLKLLFKASRRVSE